MNHLANQRISRVPVAHGGCGVARARLAGRGFTLLELMMTIAIAGLLAMLAMPSFDSMLRAKRTRTVANELLAALNLARSEAMRRGQPVSVCRSSDGSSCATTGTGWDQGWIVFVNEDGNGEGISAARDGGELLLQVKQNLPARITVRPNGNFTRAITFLRTGLIWGLGTGTFAICANGELDRSQAILVTATRSVLATDSNGDGLPEKGDGNNLEDCENP